MKHNGSDAENGFCSLSSVSIDQVAGTAKFSPQKNHVDSFAVSEHPSEDDDLYRWMVKQQEQVHWTSLPENANYETSY